MGEAAMRTERDEAKGEIEATKGRRVEGEYPRQQLPPPPLLLSKLLVRERPGGLGTVLSDPTDPVEPMVRSAREQLSRSKAALS